MKLEKKDFIEIEFTGRVKDRDVFDSNIKKDLEKLNPDITPKPVIICLGERMFLKAIDDFLTGKELGNYEIELSPEKAFGVRLPKLIQKVPMKLFSSQNLVPQQGAVFNFDGRIAKVLSVSGGRVMVDFNHPLSGKNVSYEIHVLRKIEDLNEKIKALINFLFKRDFEFEIREKKLIIKVEKEMMNFVQLFKDKFKEFFDLELEAEEIEEETGEEIKSKETKEEK